MEKGLTFSKSEEKVKMPSRFAKYLDLVSKKKEALDSLENKDENRSNSEKVYPTESVKDSHQS